MVTLGNEDYGYETSGDDWGNLPENWTYKEATAVAVDEKDNVYVFNRSAKTLDEINLQNHDS
jgi:hypothetical protein